MIYQFIEVSGVRSSNEGVSYDIWVSSKIRRHWETLNHLLLSDKLPSEGLLFFLKNQSFPVLRYVEFSYFAFHSPSQSKDGYLSKVNELIPLLIPCCHHKWQNQCSINSSCQHTAPQRTILFKHCGWETIGPILHAICLQKSCYHCGSSSIQYPKILLRYCALKSSDYQCSKPKQSCSSVDQYNTNPITFQLRFEYCRNIHIILDMMQYHGFSLSTTVTNSSVYDYNYDDQNMHFPNHQNINQNIDGREAYGKNFLRSCNVNIFDEEFCDSLRYLPVNTLHIDLYPDNCFRSLDSDTQIKQQSICCNRVMKLSQQIKQQYSLMASERCFMNLTHLSLANMEFKETDECGMTMLAQICIHSPLLCSIELVTCKYGYLKNPLSFIFGTLSQSTSTSPFTPHSICSKNDTVKYLRHLNVLIIRGYDPFKLLHYSFFNCLACLPSLATIIMCDPLNRSNVVNDERLHQILDSSTSYNPFWKSKKLTSFSLSDTCRANIHVSYHQHRFLDQIHQICQANFLKHCFPLGWQCFPTTSLRLTDAVIQFSCQNK